MKHLPEGQELFNWVIGLLVVAVVFNLAFVNWKILQPKVRELPANCDLECIGHEIREILSVELAKVSLPKPEPVSETADDCDRDCVSQIVDDKLSQLPSPTTIVVTTAPAKTTAPKATTEKISFIPVAGGTAAGTDWTSLSGTEFWLDASLYGDEVIATWEGNLRIQDGNGLGYARLYDATNHRAVDGSEVQVSGTQTISFYSGNLAIWRGQNQYRVEVRSSTGYPVTVSSARIKLVY